MLEKIYNKKNINLLSSVRKCDIVQTKNLQIVTRQGTQIHTNNPHIIKIKSKEDYPNPDEQKPSYKDSSNIFKELAAHEENDDSRQKITSELIKLINNDNSISKLIDLMYNLKTNFGEENRKKVYVSLIKKINMMLTH